MYEYTNNQFYSLPIGESNLAFPFTGEDTGKEPTCNAGDPRSIPGSRSYPGDQKVYPHKNSGLENSMDCILHQIRSDQSLTHI